MIYYDSAKFFAKMLDRMGKGDREDGAIIEDVKLLFIHLEDL